MAAAPSYPFRTGWVPQTLEDFGGGGAFPEIHVAQFPAGQFAARRRAAAADFFHAPEGQLSLVGLSSKAEAAADPNAVVAVAKPAPEAVAKLAEETKAALEAMRAAKAGRDQLAKVAANVHAPDKYFRYIPDEDAPGYNPEIKERIVRVVEKALDPLEPPKFRNKLRLAVQERSEEPPVPILREPAKKLTAAQREEWTVPPCISNWINPSGHTLPLAMRIQANRLTTENIEINPKLAAFSEALYVAEKAAREELKIKQDLRKQQLLEEERDREQKLRELAAEARQEKMALLQRRTTGGRIRRDEDEEDFKKEEEDEAQDRSREYLSKLEAERKREIIREARIQRARDERKRPRMARDISERIALGEAAPTPQSAWSDPRGSRPARFDED